MSNYLKVYEFLFDDKYNLTNYQVFILSLIISYREEGKLFYWSADKIRSYFCISQNGPIYNALKDLKKRDFISDKRQYKKPTKYKLKKRFIINDDTKFIKLYDALLKYDYYNEAIFLAKLISLYENNLPLNPSISEFCKICRVKRDTVISIAAFLEEDKLILISKDTGKRNTYNFTKKFQTFMLNNKILNSKDKSLKNDQSKNPKHTSRNFNHNNTIISVKGNVSDDIPLTTTKLEDDVKEVIKSLDVNSHLTLYYKRFGKRIDKSNYLAIVYIYLREQLERKSINLDTWKTSITSFEYQKQFISEINVYIEEYDLLDSA